MRIRGQSMAPLLRDGQRVLVAPLKPHRKLRVGDIVAVRDGGTGTPVLHRVIKLREKRIWTLGDGNARPEGPWARQDVMGTLVGLQNGSGQWCRPDSKAIFWSARTIRLPLPIRRRINRFIAPLMEGPLMTRPKPAPEMTAGAPKPDLDLPEHLETQEVGRELFVHDRRTGDVVILNATARVIWSLSRRGLETGAIIEALEEKYRLPDPSAVRKDVEEVLARVGSLTAPI